MKKRLVAIGVASVLLLCGCQKEGTSDTTQTMKEAPVSQTVSYQEQALEFAPTNIYGENRMIRYNNVQMDSAGTLYMFVQEFDGEKDFCISKCEMVDGEWKAVEVPWISEVEKWLQGKVKNLKTVTLADCQYGADGYVYAQFTKNTMTPEEYYKDSGKNQNSYYITEQYLLKIDEKTNQIAGLDLPDLSEVGLYKHFGMENSKATAEDAQISCRVKVLRNGDYYVTCANPDSTGLYSQTTGEKLTEGLDMSKVDMSYTDMVVGDGFYAIGVGNSQTKRIEVNVYDEDGDLMVAMPTGVAYRAEDVENGQYDILQLGVSDNTILLATQDGIYEVDYGEEEFTKVVDADQDQCYYLSPEYKFYSGATILKGNDDDYYLQMYKEKMSDTDKPYLCHYVKK